MLTGVTVKCLWGSQNILNGIQPYKSLSFRPHHSETLTAQLSQASHSGAWDIVSDLFPYCALSVKPNQVGSICTQTRQSFSLCFMEIAGAKVRCWLLPKTIRFMAGLGAGETHSQFSCLLHTVNIEWKNCLICKQKPSFGDSHLQRPLYCTWTVISSLLDHLLANTDHLPLGNYMVITQLSVNSNFHKLVPWLHEFTWLHILSLCLAVYEFGSLIKMF